MVILTIAVHLSKRSGFFAIQLGRLIRTYEYIMKVFRQKVPVHSTFYVKELFANPTVRGKLSCQSIPVSLVKAS